MTAVNIALEIFGMIVTVLLFIYSVAERELANKQTNLFIYMLVVNFLVLLCDCLTWIFEYQAEYEIYLYIWNFMVYSLGYVVTALFTYFLLSCLSEKSYISIWIGHIIGILCAIAILLVVVSLFNHMYFSFDKGDYVRGDLYWLSQAYPIVIIFFDMFLVIRYSKDLGWHDTMIFLSYGVCPVIAMAIQIKIYGITLLYIATTVSLLSIYIGIQVEHTSRLKQKEAELAQIKIAVTLSQIQPHFLYNTISSIQAMCENYPEMAEEALNEFSIFLRGNMDSLSSQTPIHFTKEIEHVKSYLSLEQMRFGQRLQVNFDIQEEDFFLPALTIQPIVENAVKYGIGGKEEGGSVTISTKLQENQVVITVQDDGVGFDAKRIEDIPRRNDGRSHIGLLNVKKRLKEMSNGDIIIDSNKKSGTKVIIIIPDRGILNEHTCSG